MTRRPSIPLLLAAILLGGCDGWPESPTRAAPAPPPEGSVARGAAAERAALAPPGPAADAALLRLGADRYGIYCVQCHGTAGRGDGVVVARGHPPIPPLPADPARTMAAVADNLAGAHPLADRLPPRERWAVARHVEALRNGAP